MSLANNVEDRAAAKDFITLAGEQRPHFWRVVVELAREQITDTQVITNKEAPLTQTEAAAFEETKIEFGKYEGQPIYKIPTEYLAWLTEREFDILLRRYVKSDSFKRRQELGE